MDYGDEQLLTRFWDKAYPEPNTGCWLWGGSADRDGYGWFRLNRKTVYAHRLMTAAVCGDSTPGQLALHSCDQPSCVNPEHLRWGTLSDNQMDNIERGGHYYANKTHCPRGHPYDEANTRVYRGGRFCRACNRGRSSVSRV